MTSSLNTERQYSHTSPSHYQEVIAAEISTVTRCYDQTIQWQKLNGDRGAIFDLVNCASKELASVPNQLAALTNDLTNNLANNSANVEERRTAIIWIILVRDRMQFLERFPHLKIKKIRFHTPFRYLLSGGLSVRQLVPDVLFEPLSILEQCLSSFSRYLCMFMTVELEYVGAGSSTIV